VTGVAVIAAALAAAVCGLGWLRSCRAYKRDVRQLARALADIAGRTDLRPVLRRIK
jgi:hypothetical protein